MSKPKTIPCHRFAAMPVEYIRKLSPYARCVWEGMYVMADWKTWEVDLASIGGNLINVTTMTIGIESSQSGVLYVDDIRLYPDGL